MAWMEGPNLISKWSLFHVSALTFDHELFSFEVSLFGRVSI